MPLPDPAQSRAVLIGTSEYESLPQLGAVTANLERLQALFSSNDLWGLPAENCTVLLNREHPGEVLAAIREAAESAQDTLVVYFAGHGLRSPENDELYLALRTTVKDRMFSALRYQDLRQELISTAVNVASKVVLLDCCYSGVAMQGTMSASDDVAERARIEGTYLMTASASHVLALAPEGQKHTAFTGEIIDAISTGISDGPDLLNMEKIFWHVRGRLESKGLPIPQQRAGNNGGMISLVRNRRGVVTGAGAGPRRRVRSVVPVGLESALSAPPQELVTVLDDLRAEERSADVVATLSAIAEHVDVQEIAALLDYLPRVDRYPYASVLFDAALKDAPERLVGLVGTLRLLGKDAQADVLLVRAAGLAGGQPSQFAELARLLREANTAESSGLIASAIQAEAASSGSDSLITLVGALWSAGLGEEIERTLRESQIDLGELDALALAKALNSAGRAELAVTFYLRGLDAIAELPDEEVLTIVRTARECERPEDAATLVQAALRRRVTGAQYADFAMALWGAGLEEDADQVLDAAASRLEDGELKHVAMFLRSSRRADSAFALYRKAASDRSPGSVVEYIDSLRASGRPVDALRLLNESATRSPADVVGIIAELRGRDLGDDIERFLQLVLARPSEDLVAAIVDLQTQGIHDVASQCCAVILASDSAPAVVALVAALSEAQADEMAIECATRLITEIDGGLAAFAIWLSSGASDPTIELLRPVMATADRARVLEVAKAFHAVGRTERSIEIIDLVGFDDVEGMLAAFRAADWQEGLQTYFNARAEISLDEVYGAYVRLLRVGQSEFALSQIANAALLRVPADIPAMLEMCIKAGDFPGIAEITDTVGRHRSPADIATILNVLNLKGRRLNKCASEILSAAAKRPDSHVTAVQAALRDRSLFHYAVQLGRISVR